MNARYENDPSRPGYGIFVTLQRARDHKSLHPHGWEDSACALEPDAVAVENNALRLFVGPNVVAQLDELDTYRFLVHASDGTQRATLELAGIVYPSHVRSGSVAAPEVIRRKKKPPRQAFPNVLSLIRAYRPVLQKPRRTRRARVIPESCSRRFSSPCLRSRAARRSGASCRTTRLRAP